MFLRNNYHHCINGERRFLNYTTFVRQLKNYSPKTVWTLIDRSYAVLTLTNLFHNKNRFRGQLYSSPEAYIFMSCKHLNRDGKSAARTININFYCFIPRQRTRLYLQRKLDIFSLFIRILPEKWWYLSHNFLQFS